MFFTHPAIFHSSAFDPGCNEAEAALRPSHATPPALTLPTCTARALSDPIPSRVAFSGWFWECEMCHWLEKAALQERDQGAQGGERVWLQLHTWSSIKDSARQRSLALSPWLSYS